MKNEEFYSLRLSSNNIELFVEVIGDYDDLELKAGIYNPQLLHVKKVKEKKLMTSYDCKMFLIF